MNNLKVFSRLLRKKNNVTTSSVRKSHHGHHDPYAQKAARIYESEPHKVYTDVGYNLPFSIDNPYTLLLKFCLYFGSGFWLPFASYHYTRIRAGQQ